jgi:hypothetical protein
MKYLKLLSIFALLLSFTACVNRNKKNVVQENEPNTVQQELLSNGWKFYTPENGDLPAAYGINPVRGLLDNYFDIEMGTGLNLAVKIVDAQTNKTIRYVFVREKTKANISQVPPGQYYLKIAFGHDWVINDQDLQFRGKFTRGASYEISEDIFDFGKPNSINAKSYRLRINMEQNELYTNFNTTTISEAQFYDEPQK